jgi:hypothetical protein
MKTPVAINEYFNLASPVRDGARVAFCAESSSNCPGSNTEFR